MGEPPDNVVKVAADVDADDPWERAIERLWAEPVGERLFKLWNVPWHARGLNWGDVVRCETRVAEDGGADLQVVEVVERSGHLGYTVYFRAGAEKRRDEILARLEQLGAWFEWYEPGGEGGGRLYAVDVPPEVSWEEVYEHLARAERGGVLDFQTSWRGERPEEA